MDTTYENIAKLIWDTAHPERVLDVPAGLGSLSRELLNLGVGAMDCVDILPESNFPLRD
jgi:hypothetical protein